MVCPAREVFPDDVSWQISRFLSPADALCFAMARGDKTAAKDVTEALKRTAAVMARELFYMLALGERDRLKYSAAAGYVMRLTEAGEREFTRTVRGSLTAYLYDDSAVEIWPPSARMPTAGLSFYPDGDGPSDDGKPLMYAGVELTSVSVNADADFPIEILAAVMRVAQERRHDPCFSRLVGPLETLKAKQLKRRRV